MRKIIFLFMVGLLTACNAYEKVAYMQQAGEKVAMPESEQAPIPDPIIKVGDVLMITVNTNNPEAAMPFNIPLIPSGGNTSRTYNIGGGSNISYGLSMQNFLVNNQGEIIYPVIGKLKVSGMTKDQLAETIISLIYPKYITEEPIVLIRFGSFKVSVLGEVLRPGAFEIGNEKVSILEALAMAGDMTIYGRRENVLLIREHNGQRETVRLDIRDKHLVNSPYYYLQQNDVIYVEPNDSKARASAISTAESLSISIVGTLISLTTLIINILR